MDQFSDSTEFLAKMADMDVQRTLQRCRRTLMNRGNQLGSGNDASCRMHQELEDVKFDRGEIEYNSLRPGLARSRYHPDAIDFERLIS